MFLYARLLLLRPFSYKRRACLDQHEALALIASHICLKRLQHYTDGGRFLFKIGLSLHIPSNCTTNSNTLYNSRTDGGRLLFKMGLLPQRCAHSSHKLAIVTRMEGASFSKWGFRLSAAHIRLKRLQQLHGWKAYRVQNWALAPAPRTFF